MTIVAAEIKATGIGTAATTEIEKTDKRTMPRTTARPSERAETARMEMVTVAIVTSVASKSPKATSHATSTQRQKATATPTPTPTPTELAAVVAVVAAQP